MAAAGLPAVSGGPPARAQPVPARGVRVVIANEVAAPARTAPGPADGAAPQVHLPKGTQAGFPWTMNDGGGYRWDIRSNGQVQGGTNRAYGSGMYCQVGGDNVYSQGIAWTSKEGDEIEFGPFPRSGLNCYRRIKIYRDAPLARWLDIFENPSSQDVNVPVVICSYFNYGIAAWTTSSGGTAFGSNDWALITQPAAVPHRTPSVLHVVCGPKSKYRPFVSCKPGELYVRYNVTVPAGGTAVLCHFESQNQSVDALRRLMRAFRPHRYLRDLSPALRRLILNFPSPLAFMNVELRRSESFDSVHLVNGDPIYGEVQNPSFRKQTAFGELTIPAEDVVGMACRPGESGVLTVLRDGQVVHGRVLTEGLTVKLPAGGTLTVPFARTRQWSYRISGQRPEDLPFKGPFVVLRTGDRLAFDGERLPLGFRTRHGTISLESAQLLAIELDNACNAVHRAVLLNGSHLGGVLEMERAVLHLRLGRRLEVPRHMICRFEFAPEEQPDATLTHVELSNGDELFGHISGTAIEVDTDYGSLKVDPTSVKVIGFSRTHLGRVSIRMWNGTALSGQLAQSGIRFRVDSGPEITLLPGYCVRITRRQAVAPREMAERIDELVALLGAESFVDRQRAVKELVEMARGILPLLREHLAKTRDPEVRQKLQDIIEALGEGGR
jgi:hypothetical protein